MTVQAEPGWRHGESPFHTGEQALQERAGVRARIEAQGRRAMRDYLPAQHRAFYPLLPFLVLGSVDAEGQPWASLVTGAPGFVSAPDAHSLRIEGRLAAGDPLARTLRPGAALGGLGLEPTTRRRNRFSGRVTTVDAAGFTLGITQTMGNCPQYIQTRAWLPVEASAGPMPDPVEGEGIDAAARALLAAADTLFIASAHPGGVGEDGRRDGVDASHRGGRPGFIQVDAEGVLTLPDFVGNFHFNTLGNLLLDPRIGLLVPDFASGTLLWIAGRAEVVWEGEERDSFAGAERLLRIRPHRVIRAEGALPFRFGVPGPAPELDRTGTWTEAAAALEARRRAEAWRPLVVQAVAEEAADIRSLTLVSADEGGLAPHRPGQFLPLRLEVPGQGTLTRTYTLSAAADGRRQRISVKREGAASAHLHGLKPGDVIEAMAPRGGFVFDETSTRPALMIAGGIGITPMMAMVDALLVNDGRSRHPNRIVLIHGVRDGAALPFGAVLRDKALRHRSFTYHVAMSRPGPTDRPDSQGRIDRALLQRLLPLDDYDVYLCGPPAFMADLHETLLGLGIAESRIRFEAFGPATVRRRPAPAAGAAAMGGGAAEAVAVRFAASGVSARWQGGSLLDLAESAGLSPAFGCRSGVCGACAVPIAAGDVAYETPPVAACAPGHALLCVARPVPGPHEEGPDAVAERAGVVLEL